MKISTVVIAIIAIFSHPVLSQTDTCERITNYGSTELCLPPISGMKECYPEPIVKALADASEVPANLVLGYYLNEETYKRREELGTFSFDDYFKFYAIRQMEAMEVDKNMLHELDAMVGLNFDTESWGQIEEQVDELFLNVEVGVPVVVKNYRLNEHSFTYLMLTKYEIDGGESYTLAMTINGLLVKGRLVWMAYYINYESEGSILEVQKKSDLVIDRFMKANK